MVPQEGRGWSRLRRQRHVRGIAGAECHGKTQPTKQQKPGTVRWRYSDIVAGGKDRNKRPHPA